MKHTLEEMQALIKAEYEGKEIEIQGSDGKWYGKEVGRWRFQDCDYRIKPEPTYPCDKCGRGRTRDEGGTTFTVCESCWDKTFNVEKPEQKKPEQEKTMETTFENAKVGDRVWHAHCGWGTIAKVVCSDEESYPIHVNYDSVEWATYTYGGCRTIGAKQTLFWDEIKIVPPPRPKRKEKKTIEAWANVYLDGSTSVHNAKEYADVNATERRIVCVKLTGEYEVET